MTSCQRQGRSDALPLLSRGDDHLRRVRSDEARRPHRQLSQRDGDAAAQRREGASRHGPRNAWTCWRNLWKLRSSQVRGDQRRQARVLEVQLVVADAGQGDRHPPRVARVRAVDGEIGMSLLPLTLDPDHYDRLTEADLGEALRLLDNAPAVDVARRLGCTLRTLRRNLAAIGWTR